MSSPHGPETFSYAMLLQTLFQRSIASLPDDELIYFVELVQRLQDRNHLTETNAWWFRYYR